jgi:hypothetical protein
MQQELVYELARVALETMIPGTFISVTKVKVKVTLIQELRPCTGRTAHRWSRFIALPFLDHITKRG